MISQWEFNASPCTRDPNRYILKMQTEEKDLLFILRKLSINSSRPIPSREQGFNWEIYVYNVDFNENKRIINLLQEIQTQTKSKIETPPESKPAIITQPTTTAVPEKNSESLNNNEQLPTVKLPEINLNPRYIFTEFIVGPNNRFTHAAAMAVAENPGKIYNPLFIYGGVGLGKTHLMQAIGHQVRQKNSQVKILYSTAEKFISEVIDAITHGTNQDLRERYRMVDLLLVDDVQFLQESESTQEEFFHTFNALYESGKQIVLTSDRPPKQLTSLEDRIRSRFEWGLIADIKSPNLETRVAILKKKGGYEKLNLDENMLLYIAGKLKSNIRELEGCLKRISAYAMLTGQEIDMPLIKNVVRDLLPPEEQEPEEVPQPPTERVNISTLSSSTNYQPTPIAPSITLPDKPTPAIPVNPPAKPVVPPPTIPLTPPQFNVPTISIEIPAPEQNATTPEIDKSLKPVDVIYFYPDKKITEFETMKTKFTEVIKKHKLKFRLEGIFEKGYNTAGKINYTYFVELCRTNKIGIAIVLGPPPDSPVSPTDFANLLAAMMEDENISLQFLPFAELNKEYRYLNLALDITLIKHRELLK